MKKLLVFCLLLGSLVQLLLPACTKSTDIELVNIPDPIDTIIPIDTTVITPIDSSFVNCDIYVTEVNTQLPIANCPVTLIYHYYNTFGYGDEYFAQDTIGTTDNNGKLVWKWDGKPLPGNAYFSATKWIDFENRAYLVKVENTPPKTIYLKKRNITYTRIHIDYRLDTLPESRLELNTPYIPTPGSAYIPPHDEIVFQKNTPQPFDTTILVYGYGLKSYEYKLRYLLDHVYYPNIPAPGITKLFSVTFPATDTGYVNIIIE